MTNAEAEQCRNKIMELQAYVYRTNPGSKDPVIEKLVTDLSRARSGFESLWLRK